MRDEPNNSLDLIEDDRVLFRLMENPRAWRLRSVERIDLPSALWEERRRSVHVHSLREMLDLSPADECARLILPIGAVPRNVRIDLDIEVDGDTAFLLSREEHGNYKAGYLKYFADQITDPDRGRRLGDRLSDSSRPGLTDFLSHIFSFRSPHLRDYLDKYRPAQKDRLLLDYLHRSWRRCDKKGDQLTMATLRGWLEYTDRIGELVRNTKVVSPWRESATENPLLAVPVVASLTTDEDVTNILAKLCHFLEAVGREWERGNSSARRLLEAYALLGTDWIVLAECTVPLDRPFMIKTCEKRVVDFGVDIPPRRGVDDPPEKKWKSWRPIVRELVLFNDAKSNHVNVRSSDYTIELKEHKYEVSSEEPPPEDLVDNRELFSYYSSNDARHDRIWFTFKLRQTTSIRITIGIVWVSIVATIGNLWWLGYFRHSHPLGMKDMAGLLFPASIAASLLLTRSNTTLGMRVNRLPHTVTAALLIGLIATAILLFWIGENP